MRNIDSMVRDANIKLFESIDFDAYSKNPSIFDKNRQKEITDVIRGLGTPGNGIMLDVGCGTGNLLLIAKNFYKTCVGLDLSFNLLQEIKKRYNIATLVVGEAKFLPFKPEIFDLLTFYGVLHHIFDHKPVLIESHRVLKNGAILYTDHDPNYFFNRYYHIYYKIKHAHRPGFGSRDAELAEYHNTFSGGVNPLVLRRILLEAGFHKVEVGFRITSNPALPPIAKVGRFLLKLLAKGFPCKSFFTHFFMLAQK